jgi:hypothetical protein
MRRRRLVAVVVLLLPVVVTTFAACGVPTDDEPRTISPERVPDPFSSSSAPPTTRAEGGQTEKVYFLVGQRLRATRRPVAGEPDAENAMAELLAGPTRQEQQVRDMTTAIPAGTELVSPPRMDDNVLELDLNEAITLIERPASRTAYAQMTYTAVALDGVAKVRFLIEGRPVDAPTDNGDRAEVDADDYEAPLRPTD